MSKTFQNEINGVVVLDKPAGISSAKAIAIVKGILKAKKIGHAGTLDPAATGILVCLLGQATKLASKFQGGTKIYEGVIFLGISTDSDDMDGEIIHTNFDGLSSIDDHVLARAQQSFIGEINQIPPQISAVKINGSRAYELVRDQGQVVTYQPRQVTIEECEFKLLTNYIKPQNLNDAVAVSYRVKCSTGTYVRSIARDLGKLLGCGGVIATLRRVYTQPFSIEQSIKMDELSEQAVISLDSCKDLSQFASNV